MTKYLMAAVVCFLSASGLTAAPDTICVNGMFYTKTANGDYRECKECNLKGTPAVVAAAPAVCLSGTCNLAVGACPAGACPAGVCVTGNCQPGCPCPAAFAAITRATSPATCSTCGPSRSAYFAPAPTAYFPRPSFAPFQSCRQSGGCSAVGNGYRGGCGNGRILGFFASFLPCR